MKFSEFFDSWVKSYYQNVVNIGKKGDFYTSVSVGSLFGICIAKKIVSLKNKFKTPISIVEIGANEGYLLCDIIQGLFTFDEIKDFEFCIIEPHEELRKRQSKYFLECFGNEINVKHFTNLKEAKFKNAIFISNELFDTFPCEIIQDDKMLFVDDFKLNFKKADEKILNLAAKYNIKNGEIPLNLSSFLFDVYQSCDKFSFISFDYGDINTKNKITLRIYKNHQIYSFFEIENLKDFYQKSDITYDVNFSILKSEFLEFDLVKFENFLTQTEAILSFGVDDILNQLLEFGGKNAYENGVNQLKMLIHPAWMGNKFKMIEFSKGI